MNTIAATALLAYEILITSGQEGKYIWRSSWSFVEVLYVLIRYYSVAYLLVVAFVNTSPAVSEEFCSHFLLFEIWGAATLVPVVDILIVTRIYALFNRDKRMGVFLIVVWLAELTCALTFIGLGFEAIKEAIPNPFPGLLQGCFTSHPADYQMVLRSGGVSTAFQAIYLAITMFKLSKFVQAFGFSMTPLLKVFFRDGAGYCLMILVVYMLNTFLERFGPEGIQGLGEAWLIVTVSITACRMVLNIRDIAAPSEPQSFTEASGTQTELHAMGFRRSNKANEELSKSATSSVPE